MLVTICGIAIFSWFLAHFTTNTDFPVYYHTAKTILDPSSHNAEVYALGASTKYSIPEDLKPIAFIYSMAAAYLMAPLALLPYYIAKAFMIFLNCMAYLGAIAITLRINGTSGRFFFYPLALSFLWIPFLQDLRSGQIDGPLLLLVACAVFWAAQNRPALSGTFLGIASLFKLFPLAIAMVLGLRNWRILVACILIFSTTFLIPGSFDWFSALGNINKNYSPIYMCLTRYGKSWFYLYAMMIAGITALVSHRCKCENHAILVSLAIPAVLLIMPIIEYYHSTFIIFPYVYLCTSDNKTDKIVVVAIAASAVLISASFIFAGSSIHFGFRPYLSNMLLIIGLFVLWGSVVRGIYRLAH